MAEKRSCAQSLKETGLSVIKACKLTSLSRATFYHQQIDWRKKDQVVIDAIQSVLAKSPQSGFWKCYFRLRFQGYPFNHKRVYRVYCRLGLNLKRRVKKVLPKREKRPLVIEKTPNIQWALDFMHDSLYCGKRFRILNIIDEVTREWHDYAGCLQFLLNGAKNRYWKKPKTVASLGWSLHDRIRFCSISEILVLFLSIYIIGIKRESLTLLKNVFDWYK